MLWERLGQCLHPTYSLVASSCCSWGQLSMHRCKLDPHKPPRPLQLALLTLNHSCRTAGSRRSIGMQGSSAVAQARTQKRAEDPEDNDSSLPGQISFSEVTRLRPYTSLYIPPGSQSRRIRGANHSNADRRVSQSLPREGEEPNPLLN